MGISVEKIGGGVYEFERDDGGKLIAIVDRKEIVDKLHELYFGGLGVDQLVDEFGEAEITMVNCIGEELMVISRGGKVWVKIGDKKGFVIGSDTYKCMKGKIKDGMKLVMGNRRFWEAINLEEENFEQLGEVEGVGGAILKFSDFAKATSDKQVPKFKFPKWEIRPYVVQHDREKSKKRLIWMGIGFLLILGMMVAGGVYVKKQKEKRESVEAKIMEILADKFNEAEAVTELNPVRSRELVLEIEADLSKLKNPELQKKRLDMLKEKANGIRRPAATEVIDLGMVREGMKGDKMVMIDDRLWMLDIEGGRLIKIDPVKKSGEVVAGKEQVGGAEMIAGYPGKITAVSGEGVTECLTVNMQCSSKIKGINEWRDVEMWAGNTYMLATDQILVNRGASNNKDWLAENQILGTSMTIDGNIWVLGDRKILKFTRGVKEGEFEVDGGNVIYTNDELEDLFVLDSQNGRVFVIKKTGDYVGQYVFEQTKDATDLVVDGSKMYVLAGSKIWEIDL